MFSFEKIQRKPLEEPELPHETEEVVKPETVDDYYKALEGFEESLSPEQLQRLKQCIKGWFEEPTEEQWDNLKSVREYLENESKLLKVEIRAKKITENAIVVMLTIIGSLAGNFKGALVGGFSGKAIGRYMAPKVGNFIRELAKPWIERPDYVKQGPSWLHY